MKTNQIKEQIVTRISGASEQVSSAVINQLATAEIEKRTKIIADSVMLIGKMEQKQTELEVGDLVTYSKAGEKDVKYSEATFNKINLLKENIAKAYEACDMALKENNEDAYRNLTKVMKSVLDTFNCQM